jgi:Ca2+-binding RTX toxin-like protein
MRKGTVLLAAMAVMVMLFAVAAYAAQIQGTNQDDLIFESNRNDLILGRDGSDNIDATEFGIQDPNFPQGDKDDLRGNRHADVLNSADGDHRDEVDGGTGFDQCTIDVGDEWEDCEVLNGTPV